MPPRLQYAKIVVALLLSSPVIALSQPAAVDLCQATISPGDLSVGVSAKTDLACSIGGLGCFSSRCRFCRLFNSTQSASFIACPALPSPQPLAFDLHCASTVSKGDASRGIDIVTDVSCILGGVGCVSDVCRFCQVWPTDESRSFLRCRDVDTNDGSDISFTPFPSNDKDNGIVVGSTDRPMLDMIVLKGSSTSAVTPTDACAQIVSKGDFAVGISAMSDRSCASGGLGCFSATCRFCKMHDTPQAAYMLPCASL